RRAAVIKPSDYSMAEVVAGFRVRPWDLCAAGPRQSVDNAAGAAENHTVSATPAARFCWTRLLDP
ncbi:hypothetical protein ABZ375_39895, partial [Streptomyces tibetensis]